MLIPFTWVRNSGKIVFTFYGGSCFVSFRGQPCTSVAVGSGHQLAAQRVRLVAGLGKGGALCWGVDARAPGFWREHYRRCPCWKTSLLSWYTLGEQRIHSQNRGLSVVVNWIFFIMIVSWSEYYSVSPGHDAFRQLLLLWELSNTCSHTTHKPPLSELWVKTANCGHLFEESSVGRLRWRV